MWLLAARRLLGVSIAILSLSLTAQAEMDLEHDYGSRVIIRTPTPTFQPPQPTSTPTPDPVLQSIYATAIAAATERAGRPPSTPYPTYVTAAPTTTPGMGGDITDRYKDYISKVADKVGVPDPNVTVVDYHHSALAQLRISPSQVASRPDLAGFYFRPSNMIVLITPMSKFLDHYTLWHEVTHALMDAPDCDGMTLLSVEESACVHDKQFLYLEKAVWQAFNQIMNRDISYGAVDTCEQAKAAGFYTRQGEIGPGVGYPIAYVNQPDADGDGVVCEVERS